MDLCDVVNAEGSYGMVDCGYLGVQCFPSVLKDRRFPQAFFNLEVICQFPLPLRNLRGEVFGEEF